MADVKIGMMLTDDTRSIKKRTDETKGLNKELERTNKLSNLGGGQVAPGEVVSYNRARSAGGTGAGARDFAKQAEGLGGVVRLYATFAANIFAVSAAFGALNKAAQMERLVQASDLMSQRVGVNLKGLGRDLQEATGYAISFEESMRFANLGTSAGIAAADLKELVTIAKGAAVGLGRDVNDSITRIVQGTAKQEQEILDELGIFIKAKDAYEEYARKFNIEGGADALSAQQKVRAYSDAVKQAGQQWKDFAAIPDPFSNITARGQEAINEILMTVNKLVVPVLEFLAKSGDAINGLILLISGSLVKRALPELASAFTQIFTFDSAKNKANAARARQEIVSEYNKITQELTAAKAVQDRLVAQSFTGVAGALGGMAAARATKTTPEVVGITTRKLASAIYGTTTSPKDISKLKSAEDINNKILGILKEQVREQVKKGKDADAYVQKLIQNKYLEAASTKDNLILSQQAQKVGNSIYNDVTKTAAAKKTLVDVTSKYLDLERQVQNVQTSTTTVVSRQATQRVSNTGVSGGPAAVAGTAALSASAAVAAVTLKEAFSSGLAQVGDRSRELKAQLDQGPIKSFKAFTGAIKDNLVSITTAGTGLTRMGKIAAGTGAAIGALGTIASGALRLLSGAFGPVLIIFSLWEMFGDKLFKTNAQLRDLAEKSKSLYTELNNVAQAIGYATENYEKSSKTPDNYLKYVQTVNTSLRSQSDILQQLINLEKERNRVAQGLPEPSVGEQQRQRVQDAQRRLGVSISADDQKRLDAAYAALDRSQAQQFGASGQQRAAIAQQVQDTSEALIRFSAFYSKNNDLQKGLILEKENVKTVTELYDKIRDNRTNLSNDLKENLKIPIDAGALNRAAVTMSAYYNPALEIQKKIRELESKPAASSTGTQDALSTVNQVIAKLAKEGEVQEANAAAIASSFKNAGEALADLKKKLKDLPSFSNIAKTPEGMPVEKYFNDAFAAIRKGGKEAEPALNGLISLTDSLQSMGVGPNDLKVIERLKNLGGLVKGLQRTDITPQERSALTSTVEEFVGALLPEYKTSLENINNATSDYTKVTRDSFSNSLNLISKNQVELIKSSIAQANLNEKISKYESILGSIPFDTIRDAYNTQLKIAQTTYDITQQQAALDRDRILLKRDAGKEEQANALKAYNNTMAQASASRAVAEAEADRVLKAQLLSAELNKITKQYEDLARKQDNFNRIQQAEIGLKTAKESKLAVSMSPVQTAQLSAQQQSRDLQNTLSLDIANLKRAEDQKIAEILAKAGAPSVAQVKDPVITAEILRQQGIYAEQRRTLETIYEINQARVSIEKQIAESAARTQMAQEAISQRYEDKTAENQLALDAVDLEKQRLQQLYEQGKISGDQLDAANREVALIQRQIQYRNKLNEINERYEAKRAELDEKLLTGGDSAYLSQQVTRNEQLRKRDLENLKDTYNAQEQIYNNMENFTRRQQAWSSSIENYFDGMADAFIDWANTGKFSSKDLFNSLIADIARYEIRMMLFERWQQARKPVMDFLSSMFNGMFGGFSASSLSAGFGTAGSQTLTPNAKGGVFSGGVEYFAKGGTFTNSIVNSPTLFKAAKGLGVMGEAGPEAIMPLKRDSAGTLGVRGSSSNVEVVVNNYSGEKAQTKETTDSRGNKRIEVIVGEAVAAQVGKTGSPVQRSLGMTYGMAPQLIRR